MRGNLPFSWTAAALLVAFGSGCQGCSSGSAPQGPDARGDAAQCGDSAACTAPAVCRYNTCVAPPTACTNDEGCVGDNYCDETTSECLPYGVGPGGDRNTACKRTPEPGVFLPGVQCEWIGPPQDDPFPNHYNILTTPVVAQLESEGEFTSPSIIVTTYNFTDGGAPAAQSSDPNYFGVVRILDGRSCVQQATLAMPTVVGSGNLAVADLGGDDATPEIVAPRSDGGLVAWTKRGTQWDILWQTTSRFMDTNNNWAGPSIYDLDDDGKPEVLMGGNVWDAAGNSLDETLGLTLDNSSTGYIPVVADIDGDGNVELIAGVNTYQWDRATKKWALEATLASGQAGYTAVADFGTFGADPANDNRAALDGKAEIATISRGVARIHTIDGRLLFTANLVGAGYGGPPTIADFDGDGRAELASAGAAAYNVFDMDCQGTPDAATCPSLTTTGILWSRPSQDASSNRTGSSVFDFDGDARAEAVYGDECFTRVYDGVTGNVVYSHFRRSCTWYENPVIADVDNDFNAEIISTSNTNCPGISCPAIDPIFDGIQCMDQADCPGQTLCMRDAPTDTLGRCRCSLDADCGGDGFVCADPIAGASAVGKVCRAGNPGANTVRGLQVLADGLDRWVRTRPIWNQHAYSVTHISDVGIVPKTSAWLANWTQPGLNNFRQNSPGTNAIPGAMPDLTVRKAATQCEGMNAQVSAEVCNRGNEPVAAGVPFAVFADGETMPRCAGMTMQRLFPGVCTPISCTWTGSGGQARVVIDIRSDGTSDNTECREDNNQAAVPVACP